MATTVNKSPSGVQTRFTKRSRQPTLRDIPQIVTRNSNSRRQGSDIVKEAMTSTVNRGAGNSSYLRSRRAVGSMDSISETRDDGKNNDRLSYQDEEDGTLMDNECNVTVNGEDLGNEGTVEDTKSKHGKQLKTMVNRLAPSPGFVDKNSLPSDLMTRKRVKRVASVNAAAKVTFILEQSSPLAGRSINNINAHSKKLQHEDNFQEFADESYSVKPRGRPRLENISTNNSNFLKSPRLLNDAAHSYLANTNESKNSVTLRGRRESVASFKRPPENDAEFFKSKRVKIDGGFVERNYEQNGDFNTIITHRRFVKGKEVVDVGLQVKLPKVKSSKDQDSSIQCTCRSSTVMDIPVKSYVSTYANGTLVSIPITKTHRLTPQVPEKPLPELAQGDLANRSKRVAGLNSRAMLNAILCEERQVPAVENATKITRKLPHNKSCYEHGLSNTVPSKLKIPKINFAATSTSNFGGRKVIGSQKTTWSKSGFSSHDGPKRTNGWYYLGSPIIKPYYYNDTKVMRKYYIGIKRNDEIIYVRDSVLLKSGPRRKDLPFVARVSGFWEEDDGPHAGEMMMSVLWYYRPEQTEMGKQPHIHGENEILASRHKDDNSVACIVDKCYVLSYPEYCRHRAAVKRSQDSRISSATPVPPAELKNATRERIPSTCDPKLVFFCRQIYDYRMGRILKNPLYI